MRRTIAIALLASSTAAGVAGAGDAWTPATLWDVWPQARVVPTAAPCLRHAELLERLRALESRHGGRLAQETIGQSFEGRPIQQLTLGRGPRKVLLWSQMHGDEPSATPAILDVADYLLSHADDPAAVLILERLTLVMIPMLNPDGAERYQRRNAQAIDVNRDALNLATPEGNLLKAVRDRHQPELGFNLHDQNRRTTVTGTGTLASIALLAVSGDAEGTVTPGRLRAKRACTAIHRALSPFVPGGISRYDEDWSPRAFGDNLTAWGTPVVLIETGGLPPGRPATDLTRLDFVALLSVLSDLAEDDLAGHDPAVYDALPRNETGAYADVVLRGGQVLQAPRLAPYRADVAFEAARSDLEWAGCGPARAGSRVLEVGDARLLAAREAVDASGAVVIPALTVSVQGLPARSWLTAPALDALTGLGVGTVRWHVSLAERGAAEEHARTLAAVGRAAVVVVAAEDAPAGVVLTKAPSAAAAATLGAVFDALVGRHWRSGHEGFVSQALLGPAVPGTRTAPLTQDAPADLALLRGPIGEPLDPDQLRLEGVWIDGRPRP
jgi:Zinc carboxypeptidase